MKTIYKVKLPDGGKIYSFWRSNTFEIFGIKNSFIPKYIKGYLFSSSISLKNNPMSWIWVEYSKSIDTIQSATHFVEKIIRDISSSKHGLIIFSEGMSPCFLRKKLYSPEIILEQVEMDETTGFVQKNDWCGLKLNINKDLHKLISLSKSEPIGSNLMFIDDSIILSLEETGFSITILDDIQYNSFVDRIAKGNYGRVRKIFKNFNDVDGAQAFLWNRLRRYQGYMCKI